MRTILFTLLFTLLFAPIVVTCTAADKIALEKTFTVNVAELLPQKWFVQEVTINAVPYNLGIKQDQHRGTRIELVGPSVVKGPRGINDEKESFILWVMPTDYMPITPDTAAQFEEAKLLGSNETVAVYCTSFTTSTPSWTTWKEDIVRHLKLTESKSPTKRSSELPPADAAGSRSP